MSSLTDRYVFTVLRRVPESQHADLEKELRSSIADLIDGHVDSGASITEAEDSALRELGDPDRFAANLTNRPQYLIGPETYPAWLRLLKWMLAVITPLAAVVHALVLVALGEGLVDIIAGSVGLAIEVALQVAFWVTVVFVILERTGNARHVNWQGKWTPDQLPEYAHDRRTMGDLATELVWIGILAALLLGQQYWSLSVLEGERVPVLAPAEWTFWWPYMLVMLALSAVMAVWVWRRGAWSWFAAGANAVLGLAVTIPLVWLIVTERFWNPEFFESLGLVATEFAATDVNVGVAAAIVLAVFVWDAAQGFIKAKRAQVGAPVMVSR